MRLVSVILFCVHWYPNCWIMDLSNPQSRYLLNLDFWRQGITVFSWRVLNTQVIRKIISKYHFFLLIKAKCRRVLNPVQDGLFRGCSHISYNDETWHSYTLPKEDPKNIWIKWDIPWVLLIAAFFTGNQQIFLYQEIQI